MTIKFKEMFKEKAKKTPYQVEKEEKDRQVFNDWTEEMAKPGAMATAVDKYIMEKHGIFGPSTIWIIRKRVEKQDKAAAELEAQKS